MRPPLRGKRQAARRLVDGLRRTVAEAIAPPERGDADREAETEARKAARDAGRAGDIDARFDAARERLRSRMPPREETEREP